MLIGLVYLAGVIASFGLICSDVLRCQNYITIKDMCLVILLSIGSWITVFVVIMIVFKKSIIEGDFGDKVIWGKRK